jgi:hypothetical protein
MGGPGRSRDHKSAAFAIHWPAGQRSVLIQTMVSGIEQISRREIGAPLKDPEIPHLHHRKFSGSEPLRTSQTDLKTEAPGAHHQISENASATEPASLLAVFIADTSDSAELTTLDRQ